MRGAALALLVLASLLRSEACLAEDRTERIEGSEGTKELDYRDGVLTEERSYDPDGRIVLERRFSPEALPVLTKSYLREQGLLVRIEAADASGAPVGSMSYSYDGDGRLLSVKSEGALGEDAVGMIASYGAPQGSWIKEGGSTEIVAYDADGRASILESVDEGKVARVEKRTYTGKGIKASSLIDDRKTDTETELSYDEAGRLAKRREIPAKGPESTTLYRYDEGGRIAEELRRTGTHELSVRRSYSKDGALARAETRRDGVLVLAVDYAGKGRAETLYEGGKAFVRATYAGERKVKDEFFADGVLVRTREYQ